MNKTNEKTKKQSLEQKLKEKIKKYEKLTMQALNEVQIAGHLNEKDLLIAIDFLEMCKNYLNDAKYFKGKKDLLNALAALSYAHAWLDAGIRAKLLKAEDDQLFTMPKNWNTANENNLNKLRLTILQSFMGLYNKAINFDFSFEKIKTPLLGSIILVVIILVFFALNALLQPKALNAYFESNPLIISSQGKNYTILSITVTNVTKENAENVMLSIEPIDKTALRIGNETTKTEIIPILGVNESRTLKFIVSPLDNEKILEGKYELRTKLKINDKEFEEKTILEVKRQ